MEDDGLNLYRGWSVYEYLCSRDFTFLQGSLQISTGGLQDAGFELAPIGSILTPGGGGRSNQKPPKKPFLTTKRRNPSPLKKPQEPEKQISK